MRSVILFKKKKNICKAFRQHMNGYTNTLSTLQNIAQKYSKVFVCAEYSTFYKKSLQRKDNMLSFKVQATILINENFCSAPTKPHEQRKPCLI